MAAFAFLLARKQTGIQKASYKPDDQSRTGLIKNPKFLKAFENAKERIRNMEYRFVEETDQLRQALLEIYCSTVLRTPHNDFKTH